MGPFLEFLMSYRAQKAIYVHNILQQTLFQLIFKAKYLFYFKIFLILWNKLARLH